MRHRKRSSTINRTTSHGRCMMANMLKSLIEHGRVQTTLTKAKELRRHADKMITLAKKNTLASRRNVIAKLMVQFNALTSKESRAAKAGDSSLYNTDRQVIHKLFNELGPRFLQRNGGYTRITKHAMNRVGDNGQTCVIEYLSE